MLWQYLLVFPLVVLAFLYLARSSWRTWFSRNEGCGGSCACGPKKANAEQKNLGGDVSMQLQELKLRQKK